jgi:cellobiose transport system permease protein
VKKLLVSLIFRPLVYLAVAFVALLCVVPFYWMIVASTLDFSELFTWPLRVTPGASFMANIGRMSQIASFARSYLNSAVIACSRVALTTFFCGLAGFAFAKFPFPGRKILFSIMLATMMIPSTVTVVPWFILMTKIGWANKLIGLIIPETAYAFGIFWLTQYIREVVADELIDSARIEGCADFGIFTRVVLPIILPGLGVLLLLTFMNSWNEFVKAFVLISDTAKYTLTMHMMTMMSNRPPDIPSTLAAACVATLPIILLFIVANKMFIEGLTYGALKE